MRPRIATRHLPLLATALVLAAAWAFGALRYEHFASWQVARDLLVGNAALGIAAVGATFVILSGGIDLSVGAVVALTSVLIAALVAWGVHPAAAIGAALAAGGMFGAGQGLLIHGFRLPPFLVTLAGMFLARGLGFMVHPQSIGVEHPFMTGMLAETMSVRLPLGPRGVWIPLSVDLFIAAVVVAALVLNHTRLGRAVYAVGDDEASAATMGLPVGRVRAAAYTIAGVCSALAGAVVVLERQSGDPAGFSGMELEAIAAVVIGGTLLRGGVGSVVGTALGVLLFGLIQSIIAFESLSSWWTRIAIGALVLAFLLGQRAILAASRGGARGRRDSRGRGR